MFCFVLLVGATSTIVQKQYLMKFVDEKNFSRIRGIEKAGFVRCAKVQKNSNGCFILAGSC